VLLDAGRTNSAKALQELLFEFDANEEGARELIMSDPFAMLDELTRRIQRRDH
jgi:hypothetical protein